MNGTVVQQEQLETSGGRVKRYKCTHEGCDKSFTRPVRLEEHQRSHTGEVSSRSRSRRSLPVLTDLYLPSYSDPLAVLHAPRPLRAIRT